MLFRIAYILYVAISPSKQEALSFLYSGCALRSIVDSSLPSNFFVSTWVQVRSLSRLVRDDVNVHTYSVGGICGILYMWYIYCHLHVKVSLSIGQRSGILYIQDRTLHLHRIKNADLIPVARVKKRIFQCSVKSSLIQGSLHIHVTCLSCTAEVLVFYGEFYGD